MLSKKSLVVLLLSCCLIPIISSAVATDTIDLTLSYYGPIWDINHDGFTNYLDLSAISSVYGVAGPPGWTRSDINDDGTIGYLDLSFLSTHYGETWLVP